MAAVVARVPVLPGRTATPPPHLTLNKSLRGTPAAVPNKHIPLCSPGPRPTFGLETPPASPPQKNAVIEASSLLYPPDRFPRLSEEPPVYAIHADCLADAIDHVATQPLPDPNLVFPWLHGLHAENQIQLSFFISRRKHLRKVPRCIRGITLVKADGNLSVSKLKGAVSPDEILLPSADADVPGQFPEIDPRDGFSVRNFHIQAAKMATLSDIVVYGDGSTSKEEVMGLAKRIAQAQEAWKAKQIEEGAEPLTFHTFIVSDSWAVFEERHSHLVALDSKGFMTGNVFDFFYWERKEMCEMSKASEISHNVYLGPSPDNSLIQEGSEEEQSFDVYIEATDLAPMPDAQTLRAIKKDLQDNDHHSLHLEFSSSGSILPPTWSQAEVDSLMEMCQWIYQVAHGQLDDDDEGTGSQKDDDGDSIMLSSIASRNEKRILIHCTDGYTETSLLGLAYFMYAEGIPVHEAWIRLHKEKGRNFFAYPSDVALLIAIQARILQESPVFGGDILRLSDPSWLAKIDGSLPSRILPYMYLGNLNHANNPELLRELGITRILSVGEPVSWNSAAKDWPNENLLYIDKVQDNGVDPLTDEFERCLKFIERGKADGTATLVHCRVGVSRSATICIAEVMNELGLSFPRAYCFVRARRLNVIIQPHLRFTYELLKWEEHQRTRRGLPLQRELEWATVSREIACMNRPYSRQ